VLIKGLHQPKNMEESALFLMEIHSEGYYLLLFLNLVLYAFVVFNCLIAFLFSCFNVISNFLKFY
jgi:hypothetical protein